MSQELGRLGSPQNLDVLDNVDLLSPVLLLFNLDSFVNASVLTLRYLGGTSFQTSLSSHFPYLEMILILSSLLQT